MTVTFEAVAAARDDINARLQAALPSRLHALLGSAPIQAEIRKIAVKVARTGRTPTTPVVHRQSSPTRAPSVHYRLLDAEGTVALSEALQAGMGEFETTAAATEAMKLLGKFQGVLGYTKQTWEVYGGGTSARYNVSLSHADVMAPGFSASDVLGGIQFPGEPTERDRMMLWALAATDDLTWSPRREDTKVEAYVRAVSRFRDRLRRAGVPLGAKGKTPIVYRASYSDMSDYRHPAAWVQVESRPSPDGALDLVVTSMPADPQWNSEKRSRVINFADPHTREWEADFVRSLDRTRTRETWPALPKKPTDNTPDYPAGTVFKIHGRRRLYVVTNERSQPGGFQARGLSGGSAGSSMDGYGFRNMGEKPVEVGQLGTYAYRAKRWLWFSGKSAHRLENDALLAFHRSGNKAVFDRARESYNRSNP